MAPINACKQEMRHSELKKANPEKSQGDKSKRKKGPCTHRRRSRQVWGSFQIPRSKSSSSCRVKAPHQSSVHKAEVNSSILNALIATKKKEGERVKNVTLHAERRRSRKKVYKIEKNSKITRVTPMALSIVKRSLPMSSWQLHHC